MSVEQRAPGNLEPDAYAALRRALDLFEQCKVDGDPQGVCGDRGRPKGADGCAWRAPIGSCYMPAAQIAPATAVRVSPATKTAISNRVIGQMLRIAPQLLDWVGPALARKYWRLEGAFWATS